MTAVPSESTTTKGHQRSPSATTPTRTATRSTPTTNLPASRSTSSPAGQIAFTHTEVSPAFRGRGLARQLVVWELDDVRSGHLTVLPYCPYVSKVIADDPDRYLDLVPVHKRAQFELPDEGDLDGSDVQRTDETEGQS